RSSALRRADCFAKSPELPALSGRNRRPRGGRPRFAESRPLNTPPGTEAPGPRAKRDAPTRASSQRERLQGFQSAAKAAQGVTGKERPCRARKRCRRILQRGSTACALRI